MNGWRNQPGDNVTMSNDSVNMPNMKSARRTKWMAGLLGGRELERRMDENFPGWDAFAASAAEEEERPTGMPYRPPNLAELPAHRVFIRSPLHGNVLYVVLVMVALVMGYTTPELAPILIYGAIMLALVVALIGSFRDSLFFHLEGMRLEADAEMINRHTLGPSVPEENERWESLGFLRIFFRKEPNRVFRSKLLQVHYQTVLRTFEQGGRRARVSQEAAISEMHTLLSQGGMKLVWTLIEVLPQLGLLGTLIGLMRMFMAFKTTNGSPELEALAGFATALGTTVLANILVLILRPLYMRNERAMNEILSTLQSLMAMFILPTQQSVLDRTRAVSTLGRDDMRITTATPSAEPGAKEATPLHDQLAQLTETLGNFVELQQGLDSGAMAKETALIAKEVKETLKGFKDTMSRDAFEKQQKAFENLNTSMLSLAETLKGTGKSATSQAPSKGMERDLTQLRVLTHDTLVLLEHIASQLTALGSGGQQILSQDQNLRQQIFSMEAPTQGRRSGGKR